eukprot:TRINITY_DN1386_c0_g1_i1.p1 TRINITY_DN1386_c0_g1~~TRINITY_DN1386_c0_g1_i1.p1  ORF type:complete len:207 (+),score=11.24 TRINITY_DN1386_c0_g1_i1:151-771(+)
MKWYSRALLIPASCFLLLVEILLGLALALWVIGWPISHRLQDYKNNDGLWDDNSVSIFYFVCVAVFTLLTMFFLLGAVFPFCGGYFARWFLVSAIVTALFTIGVVTNPLYLTVRFIGIEDCDNSDITRTNPDGTVTVIPGDSDYCHGSKIIFSASMVLMFACCLAIGYALWLLSEMLFGAIRKVHKKGAKEKTTHVREHVTVTGVV